VLVDGSGNITLDALDRLLTQKVNWAGHLMTVTGSSGYAADAKKVSWQLATRVAFAIPLIQAKVRETLFNLSELLPPSNYRDNAMGNARKYS